ncbi:ribonuclease P protein component [Candidatus Kaiserbacteria bacterium]|nr:ribonuclease P protein component [Candidatus Kaiserbacteria bacterium]USN92563.1 MAG: ribonuclease P protein component [Candidatus Nomurabacteria bacterium]
MFKKNERLTHYEFSEHFRTGKKHHFPTMTIITKPLPTRKVAVVVGKKVAKSAVRRNTLKRRVVASLREVLVTKGYQGLVIVILKTQFNSLSRKVADNLLKESIAEALKST